MEKSFNYTGLFNQALNKIKATRAPHADRLEDKDLHWDVVQEQALFNFSGEDFDKSALVYKIAKSTSIGVMQFIIEQLLTAYDYNIERVSIFTIRPSVSECKKFIQDNRSDDDIQKQIEKCFARVKFAIKDCDSKTLLLFKEIEDSSIWKLKNREPAPIRAVMDKNGCTSCKYIYLMFDYAYLQLVGYNDDEADPGRGYNLYSLKWFFEKYFGEEEYKRFNAAITDYIAEVDAHIGYTTIKTLTPSSLINFRKNVEGTLLHYQYEKLLMVKQKQFELRDTEFAKIKDRFIDERMLLVLLGTHDCAESLITAEWLFDSMAKAKAIDLTIIGMGYFKAIEQLLFDLISLHKNQGLCIRGIPLDDQNIEDKSIDLTLGAMAMFVRDYLDEVFRQDIAYQTKKYVREALFEYADLRNGFFHKDNIKSPVKIKEIRDITYQTFFLLLGTFAISSEDKITLGFPEYVNTEYHKLCEYINYHSGKIFFLDLEGYDEEQIGISCADINMKTIDGREVQYSGVYFKEVGPGGRVFRFDEQHLPKTIYLGKFSFERTELIQGDPVKVRKIYENGVFIGPTIAEETEIMY